MSDFELQAQMPCGDWVTIGTVKAEDIVLKTPDDLPDGHDALWREAYGFPVEVTDG